MVKDNKDLSKDTEPTVEPTYPRLPETLADSLIPDELPAAPFAPSATSVAPIVDPQQLAEEIEREQGHQTMVICRTPRTRLKLSQMRDAIKVNPLHPVAIAFAKGIKGFPDDYPKVFHVEKPDLEALLQGKYIKKDVVTDDDGNRYERKTLVDTPPSKPVVPSLLSKPVNQSPVATFLIVSTTNAFSITLATTFLIGPGLFGPGWQRLRICPSNSSELLGNVSLESIKQLSPLGRWIKKIGKLLPSFNFGLKFSK